MVCYINPAPEWWNLVDTKDLKSFGACPRDGSSPSSGTNFRISTVEGAGAVNIRRLASLSINEQRNRFSPAQAQ